MANAITAHTINNGARNLIIQYNLVADGSGNYSDFTLLDLNEYLEEPRLEVPTDFKVMALSDRNGVGTTFKLFFGSGASRLFFESIPDRDFNEDWTREGGLITGVANTDLTVRMSTIGFDANLDTISLKLSIKKKFGNPQP